MYKYRNLVKPDVTQIENHLLRDMVDQWLNLNLSDEAQTAILTAAVFGEIQTNLPDRESWFVCPVEFIRTDSPKINTVLARAEITMGNGRKSVSIIQKGAGNTFYCHCTHKNIYAQEQYPTISTPTNVRKPMCLHEIAYWLQSAVMELEKASPHQPEQHKRSKKSLVGERYTLQPCDKDNKSQVFWTRTNKPIYQYLIEECGEFAIWHVPAYRGKKQQYEPCAFMLLRISPKGVGGYYRIDELRKTVRPGRAWRSALSHLLAEVELLKGEG